MKILTALLIALSVAGCARDKQLHAAAGLAVSGAVTAYTGSAWKGCAAALGVGVAKELVDMTGSGTPEAADALATGAACTVWHIKW